MTGMDKMDVSALKEYFRPLQDWLEDRLGNETGDWSDECSYMTMGDEARQWLDEYEVLAEEAYSRSSDADWQYETDIRQETEWEKVRAVHRDSSLRSMMVKIVKWTFSVIAKYLNVESTLIQCLFNIVCLPVYSGKLVLQSTLPKED